MTTAQESSWRIFSAAVMPSIFGILTSMTHRSGSRSSASWTASSPSAASQDAALAFQVSQAREVVDKARAKAASLPADPQREALLEEARWMVEELPEDRPRHLLGISEPEDLFEAVAAGADTFDCVNPSRVARNAAIYTAEGRYNVTTARNRRAFETTGEGCVC